MKINEKIKIINNYEINNKKTIHISLLNTLKEIDKSYNRKYIDKINSLLFP